MTKPIRKSSGNKSPSETKIINQNLSSFTNLISNSEMDQILEIIHSKIEDMRDHGTQLALISESSSQKFSDPFRVLIGCIISLRTKDEVTGPATDRLFDEASTPELISNLNEEKIANLIYPAGFYRNKSVQIKEISRQIYSKFDSNVPDDIETLLRFKGVGRKTANLVITKGFGKMGICVDTHVGRITHRFGYIAPKKLNEKNQLVFHSNDEVEMILRKKLSKKWWIPINELLVTWGQQICKPISPKCDSECNISHMCKRVGVTKSR